VGNKDLLISYSGYYTERIEGVSVTAGNTLSVRDVRLMRKRPPLDDVTSLGGFPTFAGKAASDYSGYSVSGAGDVNGDGYDDILIGAFGADVGTATFVGETYLVYGRPGMDLSTALISTPDVTFTGKAAGDYSGISVSSAGDVNGDGYDDILIGAYKADVGTETDAGETYLVYGDAGLTGSIGLASADATFTGKAAGDWSGLSVSGAGDVNGDGYDDILIGAYYADVGTETAAGETYLIYGSANLSGIKTLDSTDGDSVPSATFTGKAATDYSGRSVSGAGDVNGDGYDDILIGAYSANVGTETNAGETYLIFGGTSLTGTIGLASAVVTFTGKAASDYSGSSVSGAGDVNGDGYDDILIGAYWADVGTATKAGETYLVYGSASLTGTIGLASADVTFTGKAAIDYSGVSVSGAGDVNGDGYDDILIGAWQADVGTATDAGETYLIYGSASLTGTIGLASADVTFTGKAAGDYNGYSASSGGDVNGDGYDDILIGAYKADVGTATDAGESYLIMGRERAAWTAPNLLSGTANVTMADATFTGKTISDWSGRSVSGAGDVNGDGYDDILIGAHRVDVGTATDAGETYLVYGRPGMDLSTALLSAPDVTFTGKSEYNDSGYSVSGAGDVNGDGYDDILIGAYGTDVGTAMLVGETYLIYGGASLTGTIGLASAGVTFTGKAADDRSGYSVSGAGDVNGDGYDDILIGAYGTDVGTATDAGETYLIYGSSTLSGTVSLSGANATFTGKTAGDNSGRAVSSAGDVNGDGYDDILIGANRVDVGTATDAGETYLIYGSANLSGTKTLDSTDSDIVPSATFTGKAASDFSGSSVSGAGDVNGDGYDDILIGAYWADVGTATDAGATYLIYGGTSLSDIGLALADATFTGKAASDYSGVSVSGAGDVNGDGFDDILVGAYQADVGTESNAGETYLIYGGASLTGTIGLASADATFTGKDVGDYSGYSVSGAGDVNGDWYDDILIGAFWADPGGNSFAGETYLFLGIGELLNMPLKPSISR
jgi:hypothetical protein